MAVTTAQVSLTDRETQLARYREVRRTTERLCRPLAIEDYVVQSMPDASPAKWHLAHTTWFFETFVLDARRCRATRPFDPRYGYLFNSYYNAVGERLAAAARGLLSRPTVAEVYALPRRRSTTRMPTLARPRPTSRAAAARAARRARACTTSSSTRS